MPVSSLDDEIDALRRRLEDAEEMRRAIAAEALDGFVVGSDAAEQKVVLIESASHRSLLERMHQGAVTLSHDGTILYANQPFSSMMGMALAELFTLSLRALIAGEDRGALDAFLAAAETEATLDVTLVGRSGNRVPARLTMVSIGNTTSLLVTDLAAQHRLAEAESTLLAINQGEIDGVVVGGEHVVLLGEAHRPYRAIVDRMQQGAVTVSSEGDVLYANDRFAAIAARPLEHVLGKSLHALFQGADSQTLREIVERGRQDAEPRELILVRADGTRLPVAVTPHRMAGTEATTLVFTDLSEQRRHREIEEEGRRKDQFLAVLAHELRNPLAPIRNAIEILERSAELSDTSRYSVELIGRQTKTLSRLVDDLLDVHRLNQGKIELRSEPIDLRAVVRSAVEAAQPYIAAKAHSLSLDLPDEAVVVNGDATRLTQVLLNLLSNSAKYTSARGRINVALDRGVRGGRLVARIRVSDNGIGIPRDLLGTIFDPYVQVSHRGDEAGGLGLGLSVALRLVELHGGTIRAESQGLGRGSTFVIELPLSEGQRVATNRELERSEPRSRAMRVLVADDNADNANSLAMLLRLMGHEARVAGDGVEAVAIADDFRPEVAFVDIGMPRMDGYATARALRERPWAAELVLYALTGWGQAEDRERAAAAGFDSHFVKPIEPDALMKALQSRARPS